MLGVICESFSCTPDVALQQDMRMVVRILEARMMGEAKAIHSADVSQMEKQPALVKLWLEMTRAGQDG